MFLMPRFMRPAPAAHPLRLRLGSDVMCEYPLQDMLDFHKARKAEATILVTKVSLLQLRLGVPVCSVFTPRVQRCDSQAWWQQCAQVVGPSCEHNRSRGTSSSCPQCCLCGMWLCLKLQRQLLAPLTWLLTC